MIGSRTESRCRAITSAPSAAARGETMTSATDGSCQAASSAAAISGRVRTLDAVDAGQAESDHVVAVADQPDLHGAPYFT